MQGVILYMELRTEMLFSGHYCLTGTTCSG